MKILLTGATGFIGRNFKESWEKKYELFTPGRRELDLRDESAVRNYLKVHKFDIVIHTANTNDFRDALSPFEILDHNLRMFYNLEKCNKLYGKMYYFGSGAEYDSRYYQPRMKEEYFGEHIPIDPYGFAKYTMARIALNSRNIYDLRLFGVYGKYEQWQRRFISNALCRSIKGLPMTISQNVVFDYIYIDDLCKIMEWFVEHDPHYHCYNVCSGCVHDLKSIAEMVNQVTGLQREIKVGKAGYKPEYSGDNSRLKDEMGTYHITAMEESIEELYKYYQLMENKIEPQLLI